MSGRRWARPRLLITAAVVVAVVVTSSVAPAWGAGLASAAAGVAVLVACVRALLPSAGHVVEREGITFPGHAGDLVSWEDVVRVRAWTDVLWWGTGSGVYRHYLDVVVGPDARVRRARYRRRSDPSLDEVLARVRTLAPGAPVEDARRFGMVESVRRGV